MIAQKPSTSTLTARPGAGMAGAVEGSARDSMSGAAASAPGKPAGGLSTEGADSQAGGSRSGVVGQPSRAEQRETVLTANVPELQQLDSSPRPPTKWH